MTLRTPLPARRLHISSDFRLIHDGDPNNQGQWHDIVLAGPDPYWADYLGLDLRCGGLNYNLLTLSGFGAWQNPATGEHWSFRQRDHAHRSLQNARAIPLEGNLPDVETLVGYSHTALGLAIPQLKKARHAYGRTLIIHGGRAMGVGTRGKGHVVHVTRDLTEYVPQGGLTLLIPGMLFRRPSPFMGTPTAKMPGNYGLAHFWKGWIAPEHECDEVLALNWNGKETAEATGSVPVLIYYRGHKKILVRIPRKASWRLNSITIETVIFIFLKYLRDYLGWEVEIITDQPVTLAHWAKADEIALAGSWTTFAPVTGIKLDHRFLCGEPNVPIEVFDDGIGTAYLNWLKENFQPLTANAWQFTREPGPVSQRINEMLGWLLCNADEAQQVEHPVEWHYRVEPIEIIR